MSSPRMQGYIICTLILASGVFCEPNEKFVIEDGPFGGTGGYAWSDGTGIHLNGPITAIEIHSQTEVDGIRTRFE